MPLNDTVHQVTERIRARSRTARTDYLERMARAADAGPARAHLSCGNLAHAFAASPDTDKSRQTKGTAGNIGIVTAYNDMLSAHQPFEGFPALIREAARQAGGTAQVAGRRARDVRRCHPGPAGHGALALQPRRDRTRGGRGALAQLLSTPRSSSASATRSSPAS